MVEQIEHPTASENRNPTGGTEVPKPNGEVHAEPNGRGQPKIDAGNVTQFPPISTPLTSSLVDRFRLTTANATLGTDTTITACQIRKPKPDAFIRVHPDPDHTFCTYIFEQHDGVVVRPRGEGDSLFIVFVRASDAVAACEAM